MGKLLDIQKADDGIIFKIRVQPGAARNEIVGVQGDALKIKINAPPLKGKANKALVGFKDTSILTHRKLRDLLRMRKCTCQGYLPLNPFFRIRGDGFFVFDRQLQNTTTKR